MKIKNMLLSLLLALGIVSCTSESDIHVTGNPGLSGTGMNYPVKFNLGKGGGNGGAGTRASQVATNMHPAEPYEKSINNLTIVVFNGSNHVEKVINHGDITFDDDNDPYQGGVFDLGVTGTYKLEFLANGSAELRDLLVPGLSWKTYGTLVAKGVPVHGQEYGFVMTNADQVTVTIRDDGSTPGVNVSLRRLAARFDVRGQVEGLQLSSITLKNQVRHSYLFTGGNIPAGTDFEKTFTASDNPDWFTATRAVAGIYSYENPVKGATTMVIEGTYTHLGANVTWRKEIDFLDAHDEPLLIKRNHLYRVTISEKEQAPEPEPDLEFVTFNIEVLDWEDGGQLAYDDDEFAQTVTNRFIEHVFWATDSVFQPATVGNGQVKGKRIVYAGTDNTGPVISEEELAPGAFTITPKGGNPAGIEVYNNSKTFTVSASDTPATYAITVTHNGTEHEVPVYRLPHVPLDYVAEYNVAPDGISFVTDETSHTGSGYFNWNQAKAINIPGYHLPSIEEWQGIVPKADNLVRFDRNTSYNNVSESVVVQGQSIGMSSDYRQISSRKVTYALRYKGTYLVSAWKYEYVNTVSGHVHMKVTARSVYGQNVTINDIANETFWTQAPNVERCFPASGWNSNGSTGSLGNVGSRGNFWSSSLDGGSSAWVMLFSSNNAFLRYNSWTFGFSVRLFSSGN